MHDSSLVSFTWVHALFVLCARNVAVGDICSLELASDPLFLSFPLTPFFFFGADKRRVAGVLLAISITVCFFPLARLAPLINGHGKTVDSDIEFAALMGNLIAMAMGIMGISLAWAELVHDSFHPTITFGVMVFEVAAFIPYVTDIVMIGKQANTGMAFIPPVYNPSSSEVWFVGAMGMIGAATFCLFLFGSYALLVTALYAYHSGKPEKYNAGYYRGRLVFYSVVMGIAGFAQLALGSFVIAKFGSGPLPAPVTVAMFMIFFPEITVSVGCLYLVNAAYGIFRGLVKQNDPYFAFIMWFQMICTLVLMVLVQTSYAPEGAMAQATPTIANLTLGVSLMPIFLDSMGRNMPEEITTDYYFGADAEKQPLAKIEEEKAPEMVEQVISADDISERIGV